MSTDVGYMTIAELESMQSIFRTCPTCGRDHIDTAEISEYKGKEMCDQCYITAKQDEIGHLELKVTREPWCGWICTLKEYDLGVKVGMGGTIQKAIDDYLELAILMKHDVDPKHITYSWS